MAEDGVVALPRPGAGVTDDPLLPVLRQGARPLPMQAIEAGVEAFLAARAALVDDQGRRRLVRNGHAPERDRPARGPPAEAVRPRRRRSRADPVHLGDPASLLAASHEPRGAAASAVPRGGVDGLALAAELPQPLLVHARCGRRGEANPTDQA